MHWVVRRQEFTSLLAQTTGRGAAAMGTATGAFLKTMKLKRKMAEVVPEEVAEGAFVRETKQT